MHNTITAIIHFIKDRYTRASAIVKMIYGISAFLASVVTVYTFLKPTTELHPNKFFRFFTINSSAHVAMVTKVNSSTQLSVADFARIHAGSGGDPEEIDRIEGKIFAVQINNLPNTSARITVNGRDGNNKEWILFDEINKITLHTTKFEGMTNFGFSLLIDKKMTQQENFFFVAVDTKPIYIGPLFSIDRSGQRRFLIHENAFSPSGRPIQSVTFKSINSDCEIYFIDENNVSIRVKPGHIADFDNLSYMYGAYSGIAITKKSPGNNAPTSISCAKIALYDGYIYSDDMDVVIKNN